MARASGSYPEGHWFKSSRRYQDGRIAQLGEHLPYKQGVIGSSPIASTICGRVVQLVRMPACHAGGRRFEPVPDRQFFQYGGYRQVVKTMGCGSCIRGFESHYPPHILKMTLGYRQVVRQRILIPSSVGSNPTTLANFF